MSLAYFALAEPAVAEGPKGTLENRPRRAPRTVVAKSDAVATPEAR